MALEPVTDVEWHDAAIVAEFMLRLDSARKYGLLKGGPEVNIPRCEEILKKAKARGILVTEEDLFEFVRDLYQDPNAAGTWLDAGSAHAR